MDGVGHGECEDGAPELLLEPARQVEGHHAAVGVRHQRHAGAGGHRAGEVVAPHLIGMKLVGSLRTRSPLYTLWYRLCMLLRTLPLPLPAAVVGVEDDDGEAQ